MTPSHFQVVQGDSKNESKLLSSKVSQKDELSTAKLGKRPLVAEDEDSNSDHLGGEDLTKRQKND